MRKISAFYNVLTFSNTTSDKLYFFSPRESSYNFIILVTCILNSTLLFDSIEYDSKTSIHFNNEIDFHFEISTGLENTLDLLSERDGSTQQRQLNNTAI